MNDARPTILSGEERDRMRVTREEALGLFRKMIQIRRFEELAEEAYGRGRIGGFLHLYIGEEAVAVGSFAGLEPDDDVITHYRDHGYVLARGVDPRRVMAELYGKATGLSKGKGGSMHLADVTRHVWGGYAIVGGHVPIAAGMALAHRYRNLPSVVACFLGDGATNIGTFFSSMNMAAVWRLPLVMIVENNRYGMGTAVQRASAVEDMYRKASAFDIPAVRIDGNDVLAVRDAVRDMARTARSGGGPQMIEAITYRFRGHSMGDPQRYRNREEVEAAKAADPIDRWRRFLLERDLAKEDELERIAGEVEAELEEAVRFAEESPAPEASELCFDVVVEE